MIVHETKKTVSIFRESSANVKTGNMPQVWHLVKDVNPMEAGSTGQDREVCGKCPLRGEWSKELGKMIKRRCYVTLFMGPNQVWKSYKKGNFKKVKVTEEDFGGPILRLGAYGNPSIMPVSLIKKFKGLYNKVLGYTHEWREKPRYAGLLMASVHSLKEKAEANEAGWKTFRTGLSVEEKQEDEILCPASKEGKKGFTCRDCGICTGDKRNVFIVAHGSPMSAGKHIGDFLKNKNND